MNDLARVPAYTDDRDLLAAASVLDPADRTARITAVREAARTMSREFARLRMDLENAPVAQRAKLRETGRALSRRLDALDSWEAALVVMDDPR